MTDRIEASKHQLHKEYQALDYEYNALMSALHVSVSKHLLDEHFTAIWANDYYYDIIKYPKEEYEALFHNHVDEFYRNHPEDLQQISATVAAALENQQPSYECICRMPQKGGTYIWVRMVGSFTEEVVNGFPVVYTVFMDITDLVQTQKEQSITYDNLPGFVAKFRVTEDHSFAFVYANDQFIQFFGEQKPGDPPYSLVNLDNQRNRETILAQYPLMRAGKPVHFVVQVQDKAGHDAWLQINAACIDWVNQDPLYLVIYIDITDITEQREIQKQLEERSAMLLSALEIAERANQAKSDFLSRMSHDIRTPMNAILGMLTIAEEAGEDIARIKDCLGKIKNSANFLLSLINDILDMSKIESGKMTLKKKQFDFVALVKSITTMFYSQAQEKQLDFHVSMGYGLEEAYIGDELKLKQILINLLGNAMKFTAPGGQVQLSITRGKCSGKAMELIFAVKDTGMGMEKSFLDKLFQPFEQGTQQRESQGGSGLGLAIAQNYSRMMNGNIRVESQQEKGSTFTARVWLESVGYQLQTADVKHQFQGKRVLVVDWDLDSGQYTVSSLEKFGIQAHFVTSGVKALKLLEKKTETFHLILVDWKLLHDTALHKALDSKHVLDPESPVVAVSAYDWGSIQEKAEAFGITHYLQKPLFPSTLYDFLVSVLYERPVLSKPSPNQYLFQKERILLVEDNDINMEIAQTLLTSRNLRIETARNGKEAVEKFSRQKPGYYLAILMDIQMPLLNGLEATQIIRSLAREDAGKVPIIAMSANAFEEDVEKSLEAGMNAHLTKPIDMEAVCQTLQQYLPQT